MKSLKLVTLLCVFSIFVLNAYSQDTYNPATVYIKGNTVDITINGVLITVEYLDNQPSSTYTPSTPYNTTNAWLWAVPAGYSGAWTAYHYKYDSQLPTIVTFLGYMYRLKQEIYPDASNPSVANWAWECINCGESSASTCPPTYSTGYFPLNTAQLNNGNDNTTPVNASGGGSIVGGMVRLTQERMCQTPLPLYNNDIYLRDACDPYAGLGYYGHADNRNVATPQKRYFADHDIDGPVLYGWNGGALGVRQRENWTATTGVTTEKVALQWTPTSIYFGTPLAPMNFETYNTMSIRNLTSSKTGFFVTGESSTRMFRALNTETNTTVFSVSGNGDITSSGNLSIDGDINFGGSLNWNIGLSIRKDATTQSIIFENTLNKNIALNPNGGSVSIGTLNTKGYMFGVAGKMVAEEIHVKPEVKWADYVFDSTYVLQPLSEIQLFIEKNKHLPDVPSASEVEENGISVGAMNAILLRKIEELTLYLLEQEKRIAELEQQVILK